jgi:hypothetical protein
MVAPPRDLTAEYLAFQTYPKAKVLGCSLIDEVWRFGLKRSYEITPTFRTVATFPTRMLFSI